MVKRLWLGVTNFVLPSNTPDPRTRYATPEYQQQLAQRRARRLGWFRG